jgi:hypothetical protein
MGGRLDRWAVREQRRAEIQNDPAYMERVSGPGLFAHITSVLLPFIGPLVALGIARRKPFDRRHALAALMLDCIVFPLSLVVSAAFGESAVEGLLQLLLVAVLFGGFAGNIQRLKRGQPPLTLWAERTSGPSNAPESAS